MNMFTKKPEDETEGKSPETPATVKPEEKVETASEPVAEESDTKVRYACPKIPNLKIGRFQFEKGVLEISPEEAEKFDKLLSGTTPRTRQVVGKVDKQAGEAVAQAYLNRNGGRMIRGGDDTSKSVPAPRPTAE